MYHYFGVFNGVEVFLSDHPRTWDLAAHRSIIFKDLQIKIEFPCSGFELYVYKEPDFYTLKGAYKKGLISVSDVYEIGNLGSQSPMVFHIQTLYWYGF